MLAGHGLKDPVAAPDRLNERHPLVASVLRHVDRVAALILSVMLAAGVSLL